MERMLKGKYIVGIFLILVVTYVVILGGINICNRSYSDTHKGIFTDEFAHKVVQK